MSAVADRPRDDARTNDLLRRLRSAKRECWTLRLRKSDVVVIYEEIYAWIRAGLPAGAVHRVSNRRKRFEGGRLTRPEVQAIDVDKLAGLLKGGSDG